MGFVPGSGNRSAAPLAAAQCRRSCLVRPAALALVVPLALALAPLPATAAPSTLDRAANLDLELLVRARRALLQDEILGSLNLGVSVHHQVATLWGPIPSVVLGQRAWQRLRELPGLYEVNNELVIDPNAVVPGLTELPAQLEPGSPGQALPAPGALAGRPNEHHPVPAVPLSTSPDPPSRPPLHTAVSLGAPVPASPPATKGGHKPAAILLAPVPLSATSSPSTPTPPSAPPTSAPPSKMPADGLILEVERLRRSDARYERLRPELHGRILIVRGAVRQGEDMMAFAQAVGRIPGLERVRLDGVQIDPPSRPNPGRR